MAEKILFRKGLEVDLPILQEGEPGLSIDTKKVYIGTSAGNISLIGPKGDKGDPGDIGPQGPSGADGNGSTVTDSSINGNILVNGAEVVVYDGSGKANVSHTHSLNDITDVDVANKIEGNAMIYDSATGKVKLKALPSGTASGATNLDGLTDVDTTTTAPVEGNVLAFKSGIWKPEVPTSAPSLTNVYTIELSRWGIIQGLPTKPYIVADYNKANANITGINNALAWAYTNGYNYVLFPRGDYSVCYPNPILTQPNMTIDFNFSTLKVMYDSDNKSPLDISANPAYKFGGLIIRCTTSNTNIINMTLVGDRIERSWTNPDEVNVEFTTGIQFGSGANYCSVKNCNISYFMSDAIGSGFGPYSSFEIGHMEFGSFNTNGALITGTTSESLRSVNYITPPIDTKGFCMIGIGFAPGTTIPSGQYDVYFYDVNDTFIAKKLNIRTRDYVPFPMNAVKFKIAFDGNGTVDDGLVPDNPPYWAIMIQNGIGYHLTVENCELHRNHRGAMTVGINNVLVRRCNIHDTGVADNFDLDGIPTFPDGTRYGINTEDNSGHNCRFIENVFDNIRLGIAIRGEYNEITGNEFKNCSMGIYLYQLKFCVVNNNYLHYSTFGCYEYTNLDRHWQISNNIFKGNGIGFAGTGKIDSVTNNTFYKCSNSSPITILNFSGNTFDNANYLYSEPSTVCENNIFMNNSTITGLSNNGIFDRIKRCQFINNSRATTNLNGSELIIRDSYFENSGVSYRNNSIYTMVDCNIDNTTFPIAYSSSPFDIGSVNNTLQLINCRVILGQQSLINSVDWGKLIISNSNITYNLTSNLTNALQDTYGNILDSIDITDSVIKANNFIASQTVGLNVGGYIRLDNNTFTNFSLSNIQVEVQSNMMSNEPTVGVFKKGQQIINADPAPGGNLGWICITAGVANNTPWTATTPYTVGKLVKDSNKVYKCTVAGTSSTTAPSHTTGTAVDGTVSWEYLGVLAVFKEYGSISN